MNQSAAVRSVRWKEILFHGYFVIMFIMAFQFYKERLYADSSYYIFNTIDSGFFVTPHQRIVLALSEIVPLLFFYLGASLKVILVVWSLGHVLFYYVIFLIAFYKFRNEGAALAVILLNVIGQTWLYFSPMLEICYGAALAVLFKILLEENNRNFMRWTWLVILEILVLTSHPENFVVLFFILGYDVLKNGYRNKIHLPLLLIFIATIVFKTQTFSEYEGGKISFMTDTNQNHLYENLGKADYLGKLWAVFRDYYKDLITIFCLIIAVLFARKNWLLNLFFILTIAGVLLLVNATNFADEYTRYNESLYYPLVTIIVIVFALEVYQSCGDRWKWLLLAGTVLIAFFRIAAIRTNATYLSLRVHQLEGLIRSAHEVGKGKCIVNIDNAERERWFLNWSCPIESMLLSAMSGKDSTVSLVPDEEFDARDTSVLLNENKVMIRRWEIRDNENVLPFFAYRKENYFRLNTIDTVTDPVFFRGKINMDFNMKEPRLFVDRFFFSLQLKNISGQTLSSSPVESCFFKTICERGGDKMESEIPLDADLHTDYVQTISCHELKGKGPMSVTTRLIWRGSELASASRVFDMK